MKKTLFIFISIVFLSCSSKKVEIKSISQEDFQIEYQKGIEQLVDVRTMVEFNAGAIPNSVLMDVKNEEFVSVAESELDKNKPVYLYCKRGSRSVKAATNLVENGFSTVYFLEGGYDSWKQKQE